MRITGLTLERYGTHEGRVLALGPGLTVVTGPNEAGKSTLLDAVSDLLWGFPRPVRHAYAASPARLAIAAEILVAARHPAERSSAGDGARGLPRGSGEPSPSTDGERLPSESAGADPAGLYELEVRRTTRGLFAPDGTVVEAPWGAAGAQSRRTWKQSFGLGHLALREGGARLCEGDGELAELVFTARSGRDVRAVLAELDEEADRLYKEHRNASKVELRRALSAYEHVDAAVADQMSRAGDVAALGDEIERLERRATALARDREAAERAGAEAQQRLRAYPAARDVARRRAELAALAASGVVLDAARLAEFDTARAARDSAEAALDELETRLRELRAERSEIRVDAAVTADAERIRVLDGERQTRQAEAERLSDLRAEAAARAREAEQLLERIEPGTDPRTLRRRLEQLTVPADRAADLVELAAEVARAEAAADRAAEAHREARRTAREAADGTVGPDSAAVARVAEARRAVLTEGSAATLRRAALREAADAELRAQKALEGTGGRGAASIPEPPAAARIAAHRAALRQAAEAEGQARREAHRATRRRDGARAALDRLVGDGAPADPAALAEARRVRDEAVDRLLAAARVTHTPDADLPAPREQQASLAEAAIAVERAVREADRLADGMVTSADRMAELTRARTDLATTEEELATAERTAASTAQARAEARERWIVLWGDCPAPHPDEAETVRTALVAARTALAERDHARSRAADLEADEAAQTRTLAAALAAAGRPRPDTDLDALLRAAADLEAEADAARDRRTVVARLRADAERAAAESDARAHDLDQVLLRWRHAVRATGGPADAGPAAWRTRQEVLAEATRAEAAARALAAEAKRLAARVSAHEKAVAALAERHLGAAAPPAVALPELADRVRTAAEAAVSARHVDALLEQTDGEARRVRREAAAARGRLDRLAVELWLTSTPEEGGLDAAAERGREAVRIRAEEETALVLLRTAAPDLDADELVAASETAEESALAEDLDRARAAAGELTHEAEELWEQLGRLRDRRRVLEGADGAAVLHAEAQGHLARAAEAAERYVVVHLQRETLRRELEGYERRHSSPLLEEAGGLLARLTGGRFVALRPAGVGESRTLVAVRADGEELGPGQLSEGTADQVFLALRLAGIRQLQAERRAAGLPAVPVVLDDVLMTFDDDRAAAALTVLAELAGDWQVLLFTHHEHLAPLARRAGEVTVIDLGVPAPLHPELAPTA